MRLRTERAARTLAALGWMCYPLYLIPICVFLLCTGFGSVVGVIVSVALFAALLTFQLSCNRSSEWIQGGSPISLVVAMITLGILLTGQVALGYWVIASESEHVVELAKIGVVSIAPFTACANIWALVDITRALVAVQRLSHRHGFEPVFPDSDSSADV